jgi:hypothetical protein
MHNWLTMLHFMKHRYYNSVAAAESVAQLVDGVIGSPVDEVVTGAPTECQKAEGAGAPSAAQEVDGVLEGQVELVVKSKLPKYKGFKVRIDSDGKPVLLSRNGFEMFFFDNLKKLERIYNNETVGSRAVNLIDRMETRIPHWFCQKFVDLAREKFEDVKKAALPNVMSDRDLYGRHRDGAINNQTDHCGHRKRPRTLVQTTQCIDPSEMSD